MSNLTYGVPNTSSIASFFGYFNTVTYDIFWTMALLAIFVITFMALSKNPFRYALLPSLYITSVSAIFLNLMNLVGNEVTLTLIVTTALATVWMYWTSVDAGKRV